MYTPPPFRSDRAAALAFAEARGFGTVCAFDGQKPTASLLPFYLGYADDGGARPDAPSREIARLMEEARPQAFALQPEEVKP